jgi:hypothetical protein
MKHAIVTLMLTVILSSPVANGKSLPEMASLGEEFSLRMGKKVSLRDTKLKIRFASVIEDSRCPKGVECVWQGNAKGRFELSGIKRKPSTVLLNTGIEPKEAEYSGYTVRLVKITPEPKSGQRINVRKYEATLVVIKR